MKQLSHAVKKPISRRTMTVTSLLLCVLVTVLVEDTVSIELRPEPGDWDITIKPPFSTRPTIAPPRPPRRCSAIRNRWQCVKTKPCPEGPRSSFCYWIPFDFVTIRPPYEIEKRSVDELEDSGDAANYEGQINNDDNDMEKRAVIPYPIHGRCACCSVKSCPRPKIFNRAKCRCECPRGTRENSRGQCVADCDNIRDLNLCPKIYCADNPHFRCKRVGYKCKCPSCDAASERAWCVRTKCLEQPQKLKCVFDSKTYKCRCPMCMDQNRDRPWCLMTYCGMNNNVKCRWESYWRKCFCPVGD